MARGKQSGAVASQTTAPRAETRSVAAIVEDFVRVIDAHADAKLLDANMNGSPGRWEAFGDHPKLKQRVVTVRFVIKDR